MYECEICTFTDMSCTWYQMLLTRNVSIMTNQRKSLIKHGFMWILQNAFMFIGCPVPGNGIKFHDLHKCYPEWFYGWRLLESGYNV
uniref:Uncharacterized protein n=1 Tax=Setaria italica TaxID=4555 RepID=K4AHC4_SETIT